MLYQFNALYKMQRKKKSYVSLPFFLAELIPDVKKLRLNLFLMF